jgi:arginine dihydrolase
MCPPDYFRIEYEINPWMSLKNPADQKKARQQWDGLYHLLKEKLQLSVELLGPKPGLPDLVFTANAGLVAGKKVWISNFKFPERQGEQPLYRDWFSRSQYEIISLPSEMAFEGEGDFLWMGNLLFAGYPFRTDISSHVFISKELQCEVISLELVHPKFYHLDTCFCPLNPHAALFVPEAFSPSSLKILSALVENLIPLKPFEANLFAANAIVVGNRIIFQSGADATRKRLEKEGFEVFTLDLSEFIKSGGSAKCLVLWI